MQETAEKITKASRAWASLSSRIYEVDPLTCSSCGKQIKIIIFVTHPEHIRRILRGIGWSITIPEFDPPKAPLSIALERPVAFTLAGAQKRAPDCIAKIFSLLLQL